MNNISRRESDKNARQKADDSFLRKVWKGNEL